MSCHATLARQLAQVFRGAPGLSRYAIRLSNVGADGSSASANHLGANVIYTKDYLDAGGPFDRLTDTLGFGFLRFPGGTVTEERFVPGGTEVDRVFDVNRPSGISEDGAPRLVTAPAMFDFAAGKDAEIAFVLPTENYLTNDPGPSGVRGPSPFGLYRLMDQVRSIISGDYGDVQIETFVIGNEFWYKQERQTALEYGKIVNEVSLGLQRVFETYAASDEAPDDWEAPLIGMQVAQGWRPEQNQDILSQLTPGARGGIGVLIQHFYPSFYHQVANSPGTFDRMEEFRFEDGFGELKSYVSEWNTSGREESDLGLAQASTMLEIMRMMLLRDVDYATVWGTQYLNLPNSLSNLERDPDDPSGFSASLTPAGEVFRMMSPGLIGTRVLDIDTPASLRDQLALDPDERPDGARDQLVMHAFEGEDRTIVFLSSRTDTEMQIELSPGDLIPAYTHLWGQRLSVIDDPATEGIDEGDPTSQFAKPLVTALTEGAMLRGETLNFEIGAWEIVRLEFTTGDVGVSLRGHDQLVDPAADNDTVLIGGPNDDRIEAFHGDNLLRGGAGNDTIIGGIGDDTLRGGEGDDLLIGGGGRDEIYGYLGDDTLVGSPEGGFLQGGAEGVKHFVVSVTGDTVVEGFRPEEGHTLSFLRAYDRIEEVRDTLDVDGEDLLLRHETATTRLVGAADRIDFLDASLSDFMESAPVDDVLDALLAPQPDGSVVPDPPFEPEPEGLLSNEQINNLLNVNTSGEFAQRLDGLSQEQIDAFSRLIDVDVFTYTAPQIALGELLNRLDEEGLDDFFARLSDDAIDVRIARFAGDGVPPALTVLKDDEGRGAGALAGRDRPRGRPDIRLEAG
jgi:hypothetical protein